MKELTNRQKEILSYMKKNQQLVTPTFRDIAKHFDMTPCAIKNHVDALIKKGYVKKIKDKKRIVII